MHSNAAKGVVYRLGFGHAWSNLWWIRRTRRRDPWPDWSRRNDAVFVHIPKNAGSSIYRCFGIDVPGETHCTALGYRAADPGQWSRSFSFAIVRNPWDRLVSAFHYLKHAPISADDAEWAQETLSDIEDFAAFMSKMKSSDFFCAQILMWRHFTPQKFFISDLKKNIIVDHIAHFEDLNSEIEHISNQIGVDAHIVRLNSGRRGDYTSYYDADDAEFVGRLYAGDVEAFGYRFNREGPRSPAPGHSAA